MKRGRRALQNRIQAIIERCAAEKKSSHWTAVEVMTAVDYVITDAASEEALVKVYGPETEDDD